MACANPPVAPAEITQATVAWLLTEEHFAGADCRDKLGKVRDLVKPDGEGK